jgi:hypothetical protein
MMESFETVACMQLLGLKLVLADAVVLLSGTAGSATSLCLGVNL